MAKSYEWVLIIRNIRNKYIRTFLYWTKTEAIEDLRHYTSLGYIATMLSYGIYITSKKEELTK